MKTMTDITNQNEVAYPFASKSTTKFDTKQTKRILQKVQKHLEEFINIEMRPNSVSFVNKNRKTCRIVIYDLETLLSKKNLFVVIFYANKRENLSEEFNKHFFETDWGIAMSMMGNKNILCYASQELSDGNWFNIVLFTNEKDKHDVISKEKHKYAAYTIAPKRFSWIRLHNALLPQGIATITDIILEKTNYYNFDENWFAMRKYQ
jgi:hypothetical protein